jgi:hypothetical protein
VTGEEEQIWQANPMPPEYNRMSYFTFFTLQLNHLPESLKQKIAHTDSRFRPDQRALEEGDLKLAADEKHRLEEKQRKMRKEREEKGIKYEPKYFYEHIDEDTGEKMFKYGKRDYWEDRKKHDFNHLDEIF